MSLLVDTSLFLPMYNFPNFLFLFPVCLYLVLCLAVFRFLDFCVAVVLLLLLDSLGTTDFCKMETDDRVLSVVFESDVQGFNEGVASSFFTKYLCTAEDLLPLKCFVCVLA